jgi:hypothetical protein
MTIKPGEAWGRSVPLPPNLVVVHSDAELAAALSQQHDSGVAVCSGDLARTLGVTAAGQGAIEQRTTINEFPIDLLEVRLDGAEEPIVACAHVVARSPWTSAHWLRGRVVAVMNAEFIGEWDVAPRGHPNDGRVEVFEVESSMSLRERFAARRRLPTGTHVPHPRITSRSVRSASWEFERPLEVVVDGRNLGRTAALSVTVVPDAARVYA